MAGGEEEAYMIVHFFVFPVRRRRAARVACSNTSLTPSFIFAEHSRYFVAPILRATASPCKPINGRQDRRDKERREYYLFGTDGSLLSLA